MPEKVYSKNNEVIFRKIADEYILVPITRKVGNLESIYTLNDVSARIWELIDGKKTAQDLIQSITQEFSVTFQEAQKDIMQLLSQLEQIQAIQV